MKNTDRRLELSGKFIEMGQALIKEGEETNDYTVKQTGAFMILMASTIFSEEDTYMFGELCSMFNAKKMLEDMNSANNPFSAYNKELNASKSYEDFIKRINKLRGRGGSE